MNKQSQPAPNVGAILEALRADVRARRLAQGHAEPTSRERELLRALDEIELHRVVSAHWPLSGTTLPQRALNFVNKIVRRGLRWYINPIVEQQNAYNDAVARVLRLLVEAYDDLAATTDDRRPTTDNRAPQPSPTASDPTLLSSFVLRPSFPNELQTRVEQQALFEPPARFPELALAGVAGQLALRQTVNAHWVLAGATLVQRLVALMQKGVRRYLRWLINPLVEQQNAANVAFTAALLALIRVDEERRAEIAAERARSVSEFSTHNLNDSA